MKPRTILLRLFCVTTVSPFRSGAYDAPVLLSLVSRFLATTYPEETVPAPLNRSLELRGRTEVFGLLDFKSRNCRCLRRNTILEAKREPTRRTIKGQTKPWTGAEISSFNFLNQIRSTKQIRTPNVKRRDSNDSPTRRKVIKVPFVEFSGARSLMLGPRGASTGRTLWFPFKSNVDSL